MDKTDILGSQSSAGVYKNRFGVEISYLTSSNTTGSIPTFPTYVDRNGQTNLVYFFRTTVKILTKSDIVSGFLVRGAFMFLLYALKYDVLNFNCLIFFVCICKSDAALAWLLSARIAEEMV